MPLPAAKPRALLAALLVRPDEVVPAERLIDDLWGEEPPASAAKMLQIYVSDLRKVLDPERRLLLTQPPGYRLAVGPEAVDARQFERLAHEGQVALRSGDAVAAAALLHEALALWRGSVLADVAYESFAQTEIARLEELRVGALEDRIDADLALGGHAELVPELEALVREEPRRERLREQLMLALYRAGRQADALGAYRTARQELVEELGLEPGESLRELERRILHRDPLLAAPVQAAEEIEEAVPARKPVTAVFVELAAGAGADPEAAQPVLAAAADAVAADLEGYGATVERPSPDALVGVFGVPAVREDDALRALRAAAAAAARDGGAVRIRVSVASGEALVGDGSPVATLRPAGAAGPGEVFVADAAAKLVRASAALERLNGGWRLVAVSEDAEPLARRADSRFVGREAELRRLVEAHARVRDASSCHLVTMLGAAGIGKSRLAAEFRHAISGDALVVSGRCRSYGDDTLSPLRDVLRQAFGETPEPAMRELLAHEENGEVIAARVAAAVFGETAAGGTETSWAVRKLLETLAASGGLVVVLDDLHWAQPTLLDLLEHVAVWSREPILLLCLARPELHDERPGWGGGNVDATTMRLDPLSREHSLALIEHLTRDAPLPGENGVRVADAAEGNPLFIEQMLALLDEEPGASHIPPTIHALLAARLDLLAPPARALLTASSVIGRDFTLAALVPLAEPDATLVDALVRKDFLVATAAGFRFSHALVRDAAYSSLPKRRRADLHERYAEAHAGSLSEEVAGFHLEQACLLRQEVGEPVDAVTARRAAELLGSAGRRAYGRGDFPAALSLLRRATTVVAADDPSRLEWLPLLADLHRLVGDAAAATAAIDETVKRARVAADARTEWRARTVRLKLRLRFETDVNTADLLRDSDEAIAALEQLGDEQALADAWFVRAWIPWLHCLAAETEAAALRSMEYAQRAGDEGTEARSTMNLLAAALFGPRPVSEGLPLAEDVAAHAEPGTMLAAIAQRAIAGLAAMAGDFDRARGAVESERALLTDLGSPILLAHGGEVRALVELLAGDPVAAEREVRASYEFLAGTSEVSTPTLAAILARSLEVQGRDDEALQLTEESERTAGAEDLTTQIQWRGPRARVLARAGERAEAERLAREAVAIAAQTDFISLHGDALLDLAHVTGERSPAEQAFELYLRKGNVAGAERARLLLG